MGNYDFVIKAGDTLPALTATLRDAVGVVDLSGATVKLILRQVSADSPVVLTGAATVVDALTGQVKYTWGAGDPAVLPADVYYGEWQVTWGSAVQTFPNDCALVVRVQEQLGS